MDEAKRRRAMARESEERGDLLQARKAPPHYADRQWSGFFLSLTCRTRATSARSLRGRSCQRWW